MYILNLPERTDKLDNFALQSSVTNFGFEVIPGVDGATIPNKSLPTTKGLSPVESKRNRSVGSWRAHLNFALAIVKNRLSSGIVFEDDADWDISFKSQLAYFAAGTRYLSASEPSKKPHSPYGDDWDMLWPGHCAIGYHKEDSRRFIIDNDPSVPPPNHRVSFGNKLDVSEYDNSTRVVFRAGGGVCVYSYALSLRGAQKLLHHFYTVESYEPYDLAIDTLCRTDPSFRCIGIYPQIIDSYKAAGPISRDSDIGDIKDKNIRKTGYTFNIVRSTRINLSKLISGSTEEAKLQWGDQPLVEGPITTRVV